MEPIPLEVPEKAVTFEAKLKETAEGNPPYVAITLPNGAIYARRLNSDGTDWESADFQPIYTQIRPIRWTGPTAVEFPKTISRSIR